MLIVQLILLLYVRLLYNTFNSFKVIHNLQILHSKANESLLSMLEVTDVLPGGEPEILCQIEQETRSIAEAALVNSTEHPAMARIPTYYLMLFTVIFLTMLVRNLQQYYVGDYWGATSSLVGLVAFFFKCFQNIFNLLRGLALFIIKYAFRFPDILDNEIIRHIKVQQCSMYGLFQDVRLRKAVTYGSLSLLLIMLINKLSIVCTKDAEY
mmetsp:Transcript_4549/g.3054  ORF Transcript_4549/g.3054 Transcript_4549/m.3054 type:complete len:210 (+) Transcript_4549:192-821(+)